MTLTNIWFIFSYIHKDYIDGRQRLVVINGTFMHYLTNEKRVLYNTVIIFADCTSIPYAFPQFHSRKLHLATSALPQFRQ